MDKQHNKHWCMVTDCKDEATKYIFDGTFWIKCCPTHTIEFKQISLENKFKFQERDIPNEGGNGLPPLFEDRGIRPTTL